jgi:DNA transformation protein
MPTKRSPEPFVVAELDPVREWLEEALRALPQLCIRRLFQGAGIYADDVIFGILYEQRLYLKTDERTRVAFVERGSEALRARSGQVLTSYYEVPPEVVDDEAALLGWAQLALDVARARPARPRRRSPIDGGVQARGKPARSPGKKKKIGGRAKLQPRANEGRAKSRAR